MSAGYVPAIAHDPRDDSRAAWGEALPPSQCIKAAPAEPRRLGAAWRP
jgi:hypothetical protein